MTLRQAQDVQLISIYLFWVEDVFAMDQSVQKIRVALSEKHPGYEEIHWNPEQKKVDSLLEELGSLSFFAKHKLIRIDGDDFCNEKDLVKLSQAIQGNALATLVLIPKKKTAFNQAAKILKPVVEIVECSKPKAKDLPIHLVRFAEKEGKKISSSTAYRLIELIGDDLLALQNQVSLLSIYIGDKKEITLEDVQALFAESAEKEVFALTQSILQNDRAKTFTLLRQLLDQGEVPLIIFSLLARHYRVLMKLKLLERKKMNAYEMASVVRLPAFVIEKNLPQARQLSWKKLIRIYQDLSKVDLLLKSSPMPHLATLEKFVWACF